MGANSGLRGVVAAALHAAAPLRLSITTIRPVDLAGVMSQPASTSALADFRLQRTGIDQSPVKINCTTASWFTERAPRSTELMFDRTV